MTYTPLTQNVCQTITRTPDYGAIQNMLRNIIGTNDMVLDGPINRVVSGKS